MNYKVFSCTFSGLDCRIIDVEADISFGLPKFYIVGLGDAAVQEARERVRASIKNSKAKFPDKRKVVNLAPAEIRKQGTHFDLAIAVSLLVASEQIPFEKFENALLLGELALSGKLKPVQGVLPITQHAKEQGFKRIFLPWQNTLEASYVSGIEIYPVRDLLELIRFSRGEIELERQEVSKIEKLIGDREHQGFSGIVGMEKAKRAMLIASAGGHNVLLAGSPGCGKTVLARAFREILPAMNTSEILESTKIFSICGQLDQENPIINQRPFREVHHTASLASVIGGGVKSPKPGEISLAHNGVLFFDEISEFPRQVLESLRQPLEDKYININRARFYSRFPSNFIFVATTNPCPCGYYGDNKVKCKCSLGQIQLYQKRLSGPILDRFDLFLEIERVPMANIFKKKSDLGVGSVLKIVENCRAIQKKRFKKLGIYKNADMQLKHITKFCDLKEDAEKLINQASNTLNLSNRSYLKILKVARTIADMEMEKRIEMGHIAEALQFRRG